MKTVAKKIFTKAVSWLIALTIVIGVFPVTTVFAATTYTYTVCSWNINPGSTNSTTNANIGNLIRGQGATLAGLQYVPSSTVAGRIATAAGLQYRFDNNPSNSHAIFPSLPVVGNTVSTLISSNTKGIERRILSKVVLQLPNGQLLSFYNTHFEAYDANERLSQVRRCAAIMSGDQNPYKILTGENFGDTQQIFADYGLQIIRNGPSGIALSKNIRITNQWAVSTTLTNGTPFFATIQFGTADIIWDATGGSVSPSRLTLTAGSEIGAIPIPTKQGSDFAGWFTGSGGSGSEINAYTEVPWSDTTYYAYWIQDNIFAEPNYVNPGYGASSLDISISTNQPSWSVAGVIDDATGITPGWMSTSAIGSTLRLNVAENGGAPRSAKITLAAGAARATVTVIQDGAPPPPQYAYIYWDADGGKATPAFSLLQEGKEFGTSFPQVVKTGYNLGGWYTERKGVGDRIGPYSLVPGVNTTYHAHWITDFDEAVIINGLYKEYSSCGDPVSMVSGNFTWDYTDITVYGAEPLQFTRSYNSLNLNNDELGYGWRHNYMYSVEVDETGTLAAVSFPNGNRFPCSLENNKGFVGQEGNGYTLKESGAGYLLTDQSFTKYSFNNDGNLVTIEDVGGNRTTISRNGNKINSISNNSGTLIFTYTGDMINRISDQTGKSIAYVYDQDDLKSFVNADGDTLDYTYTDEHWLTAISDFNGNTYIENTYDEDGRVKSQYIAGQGTSTFTYNFENGVSVFRAPNGAIKRYFFDKDRNVTAIEDVNGRIKLDYENGRIVKVTDRLRNTTDYIYDDESDIGYGDINGDGIVDSADLELLELHLVGDPDVYPLSGRACLAADVNRDVELDMLDALLLAQYIAGGYGITLPYREQSSRSRSDNNEGGNTGNLLNTTYPDGTSESYIYNDLNLVAKMANRDATVEGYDYDARGNQTSHTDARGNTTVATYDSENNLLTSTDALGKTTSYTYDPKGNVLTETDPLGNVTSYEYDSQGRLVSQTGADGGTTTYEYTAAGKLVKTTDADKNVTTYAVNGNGYNTGSTDPMGYSTGTEYNAMNQPVTVMDAEGNKTTYAYDNVGQMTSTTDALNGTTRYTYDLAGCMTSMTDARGNTWEYDYDAEGRLIATYDPLDHETATIYDSMGRTTYEINAGGAITSYEYDSMDRMTKVTDALGYFSRSVYDPNGNEIERYDNNGNKWSYIYDANNRLIAETNPLGFKTTYAYDANGRHTKTVSALGAQRQSVFDNMGRLVSSIDAEGNETKYEYDILGRLVKTINADGTFTTSEYNANGWLVKSKAADGGVTSYTYNKNGQVLTITDALDGITSYKYDALGRTLSVTDALGGVSSSEYDANGNLLSSTDAMGGVTRYVYDKLNRVVEIKDAVGNTTKTEYDANGNVSKVTNADGGVMLYEYDLLDRLTSYTDAEGFTVKYFYDGNGNTLRTIDGRGKTTYTQYDGLNRAVKQTDAAGGISATVYDADGRVIKIVNAEGVETNYEYDRNGSVRKITDALGNTTLTTYDSMGRVATMTDARGAVTKYTYTETGQIKTITDALGGVISYEYDLLGNLKKETNELGKSTTYTYDALSRPLTVTNALGDSERFEYDALGRIKKVLDKNGNATQYKHDANGNVIETIDALGHSSYFEYDAMNRLVKVTLNRIDGRHSVNEAQVTIYQYDKRGLMTKEINAAGDSTIYVYDGSGNLIQKTDADGYVTEYSYDARNLVEAINYSDGTDVRFAYNRNGELVSTTDRNGGKIDFALDVLGRITAVNDQNHKVTGYEYDAVGSKTSMTYPDGSIVKYTYDLLGRLTNLKDAESQNTVYEYDAASQLVATAYPNGWNESYFYDAVGQLLTQLATDPASAEVTHAYVYDPQGNVTRETRSGAGGQDAFDRTHSYDALNRLTGTNGYTYEYDSLGNLTAEKDGAIVTAEYWHNNLNQQTRKLAGGVNHYNTFDKRGNLVKTIDDVDKTIAEYVYDATNRMVKGVNEKGEQSVYIYSAQGDLIGNELTIQNNAYGYAGTSVMKDYVLDYTTMLNNIIMETETGGGGLTLRYTYGLQKNSVVVGGTADFEKFFYHHARLGSTDYLTNAAGAVASYVTYDDWGVPTDKVTVTLGARNLDLVTEFTGHSYDPVLGMYYAKARMYDAGNRRFTAIDAEKGDFENPLSMVAYLYCRDNPINMFDPTGHAPGQWFSTYLAAFNDAKKDYRYKAGWTIKLSSRQDIYYGSSGRIVTTMWKWELDKSPLQQAIEKAIAAAAKVTAEAVAKAKAAADAAKTKAISDAANTLKSAVNTYFDILKCIIDNIPIDFSYEYSWGPEYKRYDRFIISVAKGESDSITMEWTYSYSQEFSAGAAYDKVKAEAKVKSEITCKLIKTEKYDGPPETSTANSRSYRIFSHWNDCTITQKVKFSSGEIKKYKITFRVPDDWHKYPVDEYFTR